MIHYQQIEALSKTHKTPKNQNPHKRHTQDPQDLLRRLWGFFMCAERRTYLCDDF